MNIITFTNFKIIIKKLKLLSVLSHILEKRTEAITWPPLEAALQKYQDPSNADQIMRIQVHLY